MGSITFTNARLCINGKLKKSNLTFRTSGKIADISDRQDGHVLDLKGAIVAPGFIELQTNGMRGFHFTHYDDEDSYAKELDEVARYLPQTGVTGFYATIPTVHKDEFKKILPALKPRDIDNGASLLGAHAEGPYLHPSKKGAHNATLFHQPATSPADIYGEAMASTNETLKLVTVAPELEGTERLVKDLTSRHIRVSLGHSSATYSQGLAAIKAGASCLTHTLNAMAPLHHRDPGLAGLVTTAPLPAGPPSPYFSIIPDGNHLHPSVATLLFRANREKCITITDSIELAGLDDGSYPGNAQIEGRQHKLGTKVVKEGTDTLIGGCAGLDECVRNGMRWSGCSVAEAVRCATENIVDLMGDRGRGRLEVGRRADFVVLSEEGEVLQTWVGGRKAFPSS